MFASMENFALSENISSGCLEGIPFGVENILRRIGPPETDEIAERNERNRPKYEVADVFRIYGRDYLSNRGLSERQYKAFYDILNCRTSAMGFHVDQCDGCGHTAVSYNSCGNRHCPKCQSGDRIRWIADRLRDLLPVPYYHAVFTIPDFMFKLALFNRRTVYDLLFECSAATLKQFATNSKWWKLPGDGRQPESIDVDLGFFSVLHTWGQTLNFHPHIHTVCAGGGLKSDGVWLSPKYGRKFLFPAKAMSKVFRGKFIEGLKKVFYGETLKLPGRLEKLSKPRAFETWIGDLVNRDWVVYCKAPFGDPGQVVKYVGRYTHRVAIGNHRLESIENGEVSFKYKDYKDEGAIKTMTISAEKFIDRFLRHVLPKRFHRLRHYGFLSNGNTEAKKKAGKALRVEAANLGEAEKNIAENPDFEIFEGYKCPLCEQGRMTPIIVVDKHGRLLKAEESIFKEPSEGSARREKHDGR